MSQSRILCGLCGKVLTSRGPCKKSLTAKIAKKTVSIQLARVLITPFDLQSLALGAKASLPKDTDEDNADD